MTLSCKSLSTDNLCIAAAAARVAHSPLQPSVSVAASTHRAWPLKGLAADAPCLSANSRGFHASCEAATTDKSYYEILGLPKSASDSEIKKAYYKLAKQYHPDTNVGDENAANRFAEIQEAYDTLRDPQKRVIYDQLGHKQFKNSDAGSAEGMGGFGGFAGFGARGFSGDIDDVFQNMAREFFGGGMSGGASMFSSFQTSIALSVGFMDAIKGGTRHVNLDLGHPVGQREVEVQIPAGVSNGQQLLIENAVQAKNLRVSLMVQFQVQPHPRYRRKGADVIAKLPLKLSEALLGSERTVDTVWGQRVVVVPQNSQNGAQIAIEGAGAPRLGGSGRGRHICEVEIVMPRRLNARQQELIKALQEVGL